MGALERGGLCDARSSFIVGDMFAGVKWTVEMESRLVVACECRAPRHASRSLAIAVVEVRGRYGHFRRVRPAFCDEPPFQKLPEMEMPQLLNIKAKNSLQFTRIIQHLCS